MSEQLNIPVIVGTVRPGRQSLKVAKFIVEVGKEFPEINAFLVDPQDFETPKDGNNEELKDPRYTKITEEADGFFIVTPEYNHSFPGTLKRLLDLELKNYIHKPAVMAGVSASPWGGVRAIESLVNVLREMGLTISFEDVQFPNVQNLFNEEGNLQDDAYIERVKRSFTELIWLAKVMKHGRETIPNKYHEED